MLNRRQLFNRVAPAPLWRVGWPDNGDPAALAEHIRLEDCNNAAAVALGEWPLRLKLTKLEAMQAEAG